MDTVLKSFGISYILRNTFAGFFFVLSFGTTFNISHQQIQDAPALILTLAVLSGATVYACHRSIFYPVIEWFFSLQWVGWARKKCPLISQATIERIVRRWEWSCEANDRGKLLYNQTSTWADSTHFLYASALSVVLGVISACFIHDQLLPTSKPLLVLTILLFLAALISDWRLYTLHDYLFNREKAIKDKVFPFKGA